MQSEPIYIFDEFDNLLTILDNVSAIDGGVYGMGEAAYTQFASMFIGGGNEAEDDDGETIASTACPYFEASFEEVINGQKTFEFVVPTTHPDAQHVREENHVVFRDLDGVLRLFVIKELEDEDGEGTVRRAICLSAMNELVNEPIIDIRPQNRTAEYALGRVLENTRWQVGDVAELGTQTTNFYYETALSAIWKIIDVWGGEIVDRVEFDGNKITGRYIDILYRVGKEEGKLWEIDKDIVNIRRTIRSYPVTAMYGRGRGLETESGGYTRKVTIADAVWSKANGDPANKPKGQEWVGDEEARKKYGIPDPETGERRHRFGFFEDSDEEDPNKLIRSTWDALQDANAPEVSFDMSIITLEGIAGYEHEKVRLGDTGTVINRRIHPEIVVEARVVRMKYDIGDPSDGEVTLGNYIDLFENDRKLREDVDRIRDRTGIWDRVEDPISDEDYPDIVPPVPGDVEVTGLFKYIQLSWAYDPSNYIAAYEVYASQVPGFAPDLSNLVWRGSSGGFAFEADTNETWYFRLRTVNYHGRASAYTEEFSANTVRIQDIDIAIGAVNAEKLADLSVTAEKLAEEAVKSDKIEPSAIREAHIANAAIGNAAIQNGAITNLKVANGAIQRAHIVDAAINGAKIANAAIDTAHIANAAVTNAKIANVSAAKITTGTLDAEKVTVQARSGSNRVLIDGDGFKTTDSQGRTRIIINVRAWQGNAAEPAFIRFLAPNGSVVGGLGSNVNNHLALGGPGSFTLDVVDNALYYAQQHRFVTHGVTRPGDYIQFSSIENTSGTYREPYIRTPFDSDGYIGSASYRWWRVYSVHVHCSELHESSTREEKTNIEDADIDALQDVFDRLNLKTFYRTINGKVIDPIKGIGVIAEESPQEILDETGKSVILRNFLAVVSGALKKQQQRIDELEIKLEGMA